jgi:site-specific recombinase XerD
MANFGERWASPHTLRHSFAIRALRHGANVLAISKLLGYASLATTQRYVNHTELGDPRRAVGQPI